MDAGFQLPALLLQLPVLLLCQCLAALIPQQGVVGQDSAVERGMAWKIDMDGGEDSARKTLMCREEAGLAQAAFVQSFIQSFINLCRHCWGTSPSLVSSLALGTLFGAFQHVLSSNSALNLP